MIMDNFNITKENCNCPPPCPPPPASPHRVSLANRITVSNDYNNLTNQPIANLIGLATPIVLANLEEGLYNIRGNYLYNSVDKVIKTLISSTLVEIYADENTENKIVSFKFFKDDEYFIKIIVFKDKIYNEYNVQDIKLSSINNTMQIVSSIPQIGESNKIYVTDDGIFVWNGEKFKKLGEEENPDPLWKEL